MAVLDTVVAGDLDDWFVEALNGLTRDPEPGIDEVLLRFASEESATGTSALCDLHLIRPDGNGRPQVAAFARHLAGRIVDYCIPRGRINDAALQYERTGSTNSFIRLNEEARQLFTAAGNTGELGELLLFALLEELLGAPQILCKMSLKTSPSMHFHGVDGIHARAVEGGGLQVYWGEAKVYASFPDALSSCFESLAPYLLDDGSGPAQHDLLLARDNADMGDERVTERLIEFFVEGSSDTQLREICGAAVIGFGSDAYRHLGPAGEVDDEALRARVDDWLGKIANAINARGIEKFRLSVFCLPVPDAQGLRDAFLEALSG